MNRSTHVGTAPDETVVVVPIGSLPECRKAFDDEPEQFLTAIYRPGTARGIARSRAETDTNYKQLVGYVVVRRGTEIFHYRRTRSGGESRLQGLRSVGLGGHLNIGDVSDQVDQASIERSIRRELDEEVVLTGSPDLEIVGILNDDRTEVGRVHLGVVVIATINFGDVTLCDAALSDGGFAPIAELQQQCAEFEDWSIHVLTWLARRSEAGLLARNSSQ